VNLRSAFILTTILTILAACTKIESTDIGSGLIPPVDNINTFDTSLAVSSFNLFDSDSTYPIRTDNLVLGRVSNDPLFGKTTAIVNLELKPEFFPFRFTGDYQSFQLDSMVLVLGYQGAWGDTNTVSTQKLNVYELNTSDTLSKDSSYTTRRKFGHSSSVIGSTTVDVKNMVKDSLGPTKEAVNKNQIRIKITDPSIQQRLFKDTLLLDSNYAFTHTHGSASLPGFNGFAIVPDTTTSSANFLMVVNLSDTNTKLAFYYRSKAVGATKVDTNVSYFRFNSYSGFSNNIIRNPNLPAPAEYVKYIGGAEDSIVYLETRPDAPYAKIKIPGLNVFPNVIVHRAELVVVQMPNAATGDLDKLLTPPALFLSAYSADSSRKFMLPGGDVTYSVGGVTNLQDFGAYPFKRTIDNQPGVTNYAFDVTHYVQAIATRKIRNYDLVLSAPFADLVYGSESFNTLVPLAGSGVFNPLSLGRVRVGGGSLSVNGPNKSYRMRLRIIYTRI
jgi:hypothetical protein